jgi:DNA-binding MarR family transcriptional regulator
MAKERYLKTLRALAECYHAFSRHDAAHIRTLGYTPAQFDIVATLGNTSGMTFKELGEKTLITKGTLTGVVDRLEGRGVVRRVGSPSDARSTIVQLTRKGEREFERVFHPHIAYVKRAFAVLDEAEMDRLDRLLGRLREGFR